MPIWALTFLRWAWPYLAAATLAFAVAAYIRHQGVQAEREAAFKREVEAYKAEVAKANQIALGLEETLAKARAEANQLNERLKDETDNNTVYRDCIVPVGGVQLLNQALTGKPAR